MKVNIISVGTIKEKYLKDAIAEYAKRLFAYIDLNFIEIEETTFKNENESTIKKVLSEEGQKILEKINFIKREKCYIIILDIIGRELSTIDFYNLIKEKKLSGISNFVFVIGGSYGLSDDVKKIADLRLSFSKMTFPHQLFRLILIEQIYRIMKIDRNEPYHK